MNGATDGTPVAASGRPELDTFIEEVREQFARPLAPENLLSMSSSLQRQFIAKLQEQGLSFLPSYNHTMPTGDERGTYLALDVGGSNFRVALVDLQGKIAGDQKKSSMRIVKQFAHRIDGDTRELRGHAFFEWMADKIAEAISDEDVRSAHGPGTYAIGLAWSFPVEQTSSRTGNLLEMGKNFHAAHGLLGEDLGELLMAACRKRDLDVRMQALINDGSATLLSRAYCDPATRFGLILGTGTNMSVILPVDCIHPAKFGQRPAKWHQEAKRVLVNTEFSLFGKGVLPMTKWDHHINDTHSLPDFQPFEHLIGGGYLGEIARLVLHDATQRFGLFGGVWDTRYLKPYSLSTQSIAKIEQSDETKRRQTISSSLCVPIENISEDDALATSNVIALISTRAAALLAMGIHALWTVHHEAEGRTAASTEHVSIGCHGSVIELYPAFRSRCQSVLNRLTRLSNAKDGAVTLEIAWESALFGAAVAVGCLEGEV